MQVVKPITRNMKKYIISMSVLLCACLTGAQAQSYGSSAANGGEHSYIYRIQLRDKAGTMNIKKPQKFLSKKALDRRQRQGLSVDSTDLPVSPVYLKAIGSVPGVTVIGHSRWLNTALVWVNDTSLIAQVRQLDGVTGSKRVWVSRGNEYDLSERARYVTDFNPKDTVPHSYYGASANQIAVLGGDSLHRAGFRGKGMTIAIIDGGFKNADVVPAFHNTTVLGTRDFVYPPSNNIYYETSHGASVLSIIGSNIKDVYVGTAPEAEFWLLRSEDGRSEQEVEEDHWVMAAEFADSVGVDVINTSLGYGEFDDPSTNHRYYELDGQTCFASRAASMLAAKGIILVNSAGNSGDEPWKKITVPADADHVLTVGALTRTLQNANFSSIGPSQDGRVKPDVMAIGNPVALIDGSGEIAYHSGTSFSSPTICGLVVCLWQALPQLNAFQIMQLVRETGDRFTHPDNIYGYGTPDFWQAYQRGKAQ